MARRSQYQATDAAKAASEAAKVLQQRGQEARQESVERVPSGKPDKEIQEGWTPPERNTIHSQALEDIVSKREKPVEVEPTQEAKPKPVEAKEEPKVEAAPEITAEPVVEAPKVIRVKVDGEEYDAPAEEVDEAGGVKAYQIQKAAENRLKKSNEALAETKRILAEIQQAKEEAAKPKETVVTDDQFITERVDKIRFGTPEESAAALKEILQRSHKPIDENALIERSNRHFEHNLAVKRFDQEFQDLVAIPDLLDLVVMKRNKKLAQLKSTPADWDKFYKEIGTEVRNLVGKPTSQPTQSTTSGIPSQQSDKEARKAAAVVSIPTAAARAAPPQEEKPESRQDLIKEMRMKRGLPVD